MTDGQTTADPGRLQRRVLVVDDEPQVRSTLSRILKAAGYAVSVASDALEARATLADHAFDAMLCDLWMPGEHGLSLATWAATDRREMAVLVVTASDDQANLVPLTESAIEGYVLKPFEASEIVINVTNAIARVQNRQRDVALLDELSTEAQAGAERLSEAQERVLSLQRTLAERDELWAALAQCAPIGILIVDPAAHCYYANDRAEELTGHTLAELSGRGWLDLVHPADRETILNLESQGDPSLIEGLVARIVAADGQERGVRVSAARFATDDGTHPGFVVAVEDLTELLAYQRQLEYRATHDELTGLPNRAVITFELERAISRRLSTEAVTLAVIHLDRLDTLAGLEGSGFIDEVIVRFAERLGQSIEPGDLLGRLGAHEYAVLAIGRRDTGTQDFATALLDEIGTPLRVWGRAVHLTVSCGIAVADGPGHPADALLRDARLACDRARQSGGNRVEVLDPDMRDRLLRRLALQHDLRRAVEFGQLHAAYQPIFDAVTGTLDGFEALCRWEHPTDGSLSPALFIPLAEELGLAPTIGRQMLHEACSQMQRWTQIHQLPKGIRVGVNISGLHLGSAGFVDDVQAALDASGLPPYRLGLEVTESALVDDIDAAARVLEEVRDRGVTVSLDDFGTGYASFSYLTRLPVDTLKIDRSFVLGLADHHDAGSADGSDDATADEGFAGHRPMEEIVKASILLAHSLGLSVVAEGVERDHQRDRLRSMGCDRLQGYLLARPMSPESPAMRGLLSALESPGD